MNDWQYLSLGDLEQNSFFFPKVNFKVFTVPERLNKVKWHVTWPKIENEGNWRISGKFALFG